MEGARGLGSRGSGLTTKGLEVNANAANGGLHSCLASRIKSNDGKVAGKNGKPMKPERCVQFDQPAVMGENVKIKDDNSTNEDAFRENPNDSVEANTGTHKDHSENGYAYKDVHELMIDSGKHVEDVTRHDYYDVHGIPKEEGSAKKVGDVPAIVSPRKPTFSLIFKSTTTSPSVKLKTMKSNETIKGDNVAIPLVAVEEISKSSMCQKSWGRNMYVRAFIEISALTPLPDSLVVVIPFPNGSGYSLETVDIEYEWQPPRCDTCKIFDHKDADCPKDIKIVETTQKDDDGFTQVTRKKVKASLEISLHMCLESG
ncbi:hypothetical protein Tco_0670570 [Tanacetum coccineum]